MEIKDIKVGEKKAILIFEFFSDENRKNKDILISSIKIMDKEIKIDLNKSNKYEYILSDNVEDEFNIYECLFEFENKQYMSYTASIYFNQTNIFICGNTKSKNSVEIIFCNFIDNEISHKDCSIIYNKLKYTTSEDFKLATRKRINFLNIDIDKLEIPNSIDNSIIDQKKLFTNNNCNNYQILISVSNQTKKTISIFNNEPIIEPNIINNDLIIEILETSLKNANSILNYKREYKTIKEYMDNIDNNKKEELSKYIQNSESLENKISHFFKYYRENPTEKELKIYDLFSEFMLVFPNFKNYPRNKENVNTYRYIMQYYFSKKAVELFLENIPSYLSNKEKIYLKYSACCCLRYLLSNGYGNKIDDLFYFLDFTKNGTIYNDAIEHNKKFINYLKENSEMFLYFLQLNSGSSIDILSSKLSSRISMLNCGQVKSHLFSTIPNYGIRINCNSHFNAFTILETRTTCISEIKLFNFFLDDINCDNDFDFYYRYRLSTLLMNENFGHIKFYINYLINYESENKYKGKTLNPFNSIRYYKVLENEGKAEILNKQKNKRMENENEIRGESSVDIENFLTRGDQNLVYALRTENINSKKIFENPELKASNNLNDFIKILSEGQVCFDNKVLDEIEEKENYYLINDLEGVPFGFPRREKY